MPELLHWTLAGASSATRLPKSQNVRAQWITHFGPDWSQHHFTGNLNHISYLGIKKKVGVRNNDFWESGMQNKNLTTLWTLNRFTHPFCFTPWEVRFRRFSEMDRRVEPILRRASNQSLSRFTILSMFCSCLNIFMLYLSAKFLRQRYVVQP